MQVIKYIIGILFLISVVLYFSAKREGLELQRSYYNSELRCNDFCAKIKNENACVHFNYKENTKCLNHKNMLVSPNCYLYKNGNCMSMV